MDIIGKAIIRLVLVSLAVILAVTFVVTPVGGLVILIISLVKAVKRKQGIKQYMIYAGLMLFDGLLMYFVYRAILTLDIVLHAS
ncbi:MAG: hypothetical protein J6F31_00315 [Oscillospiraceae bacterium]|nr:hypothetical protein [Oscillospiraceae bacterium]